MNLAEEMLLAPEGLLISNIEDTLSSIMLPGMDYADCYFEHASFEGWSLEDNKVKSGSYQIDQGVGIRAISGEKTGFAYSDEISREALKDAALSARNIANAGQSGTRAIQLKHQQNSPLYSDILPITSLADADKVALLQKINLYTRAIDSRVQEVSVSLAGGREVILVAASDGTLRADVRPLIRLNVSVIVEENGRRESGSMGGGGRYAYSYFFEQNRAEHYADEAVRQAIVNLEAQAAPAGEMTVVLGSGWPGILLHEAIGHGLEGDFNRKGTSAFSGRIGDKVAASECTVVDDGTLVDRRGSLTVDDEGTPTENTVLIENGILKNYMQDKHNASLMNMQPTGNGRRESYAHLPMPRMTNTYMLPGKHDPEEIIASVEDGIYAANFGGGQVDITSGKFVFSASEAYRIKNGKLSHPIKGATLIGNGPDVLTRVSMVGNDMQLDSGVGMCGKEGQSVPVGVGQPTLRIDGLTVGGEG
jgi:TldD protein